MDGVGVEISRFLKTDCNVMALFGAGRMGRGSGEHEWCRLNGRAKHIALQHYPCCTLEFCSMLLSWRDSQKAGGEVCP